MKNIQKQNSGVGQLLCGFDDSELLNKGLMDFL